MKIKGLVSLILMVLFLQFIAIPNGSAATKSSSYMQGFNWVNESSQSFLFKQGIDRVFGINGKPILKKAQGWCYAMPRIPVVYVYKPTILAEWEKGCVGAVMKLVLKP